jgi:NAD(P)-dependent dehydrogenase (short-subunit alcohol dehydrogenase family)
MGTDEMLSLNQRVAVVTGSVGNLGAATARVLAALGARLALVDRSQSRLEAAYPEWSGGTDHLLVGDVDLTSHASIRSMIDRVVERFDRVDILVNTVGGFRGGKPLHEADPADWDAMFAVNVRTTADACRAVVPQMIQQGSGRIVNVASRAARRGEAGLSAYCAAKAAVVRLTESLSEELKTSGINVNCVLPGTIDTPQNRKASPEADPSAWVTPEAIADVIAFLASDAARAIHGAAVPIYGTG